MQTVSPVSLGLAARGALQEALDFLEERKGIFVAVYALNIVVYSYLFTQMPFNNHTFPQMLTYHYPSYRTFAEGRWFSDFVLYAFGSAGVQSLQMYLSVALHIVNAFLVAKILRADRRSEVFLVAAFVSCYPAIIDRYSFPGCQIIFPVADTFAILAVLVLGRQKTMGRALSGAVPLLVLCLATYQPAVALAAFLVLVHCLSLVLHEDDANGGGGLPVRRLATAAAATLLGLAAYYATVKLTVVNSGNMRVHTNSLAEIAAQCLTAYAHVGKYFTSGSDYLPPLLRWLPLGAVALGAVSIAVVARRKGYPALFVAVLILAAMPLALRATYLINANSFAHAGRIVYAHGYALLFFVLSIGMTRTAERIKVGLCLVLIYFSAVVSAQETNMAYMKVIFDTSKINRIAQRIEDGVPDLSSRTWPLVVVGYLGMNDQPYKNYPNRGNYSNLDSEGFADYRQVEMLNFFLGSERLVRPTVEQREAALRALGDRKPWPAPESVFRCENTIVVLLERQRRGVPVTWTR